MIYRFSSLLRPRSPCIRKDVTQFRERDQLLGWLTLQILLLSIISIFSPLDTLYKCFFSLCSFFSYNKNWH